MDSSSSHQPSPNDSSDPFTGGFKAFGAAMDGHINIVSTSMLQSRSETDVESILGVGSSSSFSMAIAPAPVPFGNPCPNPIFITSEMAPKEQHQCASGNLVMDLPPPDVEDGHDDELDCFSEHSPARLPGKRHVPVYRSPKLYAREAERAFSIEEVNEDRPSISRGAPESSARAVACSTEDFSHRANNGLARQTETHEQNQAGSSGMSVSVFAPTAAVEGMYLDDSGLVMIPETVSPSASKGYEDEKKFGKAGNGNQGSDIEITCSTFANIEARRCQLGSKRTRLEDEYKPKSREPGFVSQSSSKEKGKVSLNTAHKIDDGDHDPQIRNAQTDSRKPVQHTARTTTPLVRHKKGTGDSDDDYTQKPSPNGKDNRGRGEKSLLPEVNDKTPPSTRIPSVTEHRGPIHFDEGENEAAGMPPVSNAQFPQDSNPVSLPPPLKSPRSKRQCKSGLRSEYVQHGLKRRTSNAGRILVVQGPEHNTINLAQDQPPTMKSMTSRTRRARFVDGEEVEDVPEQEEMSEMQGVETMQGVEQSFEVETVPDVIEDVSEAKKIPKVEEIPDLVEEMPETKMGQTRSGRTVKRTKKILTGDHFEAEEPNLKPKNPTPSTRTDYKMKLSQLKGHSTELQAGRCLSPRYDAYKKCAQCISKVAGDSCRFRGFRTFPIDPDTAEITAEPYFTNIRGGSPPKLDFPRKFNTSLEARHIFKIQKAVVPHLIPLIVRELRHILRPDALEKSLEGDTRALCDFCSTTIFGGSWVCKECGREICLDCIYHHDPDTPPLISGKKNLDALRRLTRCCSKSLPKIHKPSDQMPTSIFTRRFLEESLYDLIRFALSADIDIESMLPDGVSETVNREAQALPPLPGQLDDEAQIKEGQRRDVNNASESFGNSTDTQKPPESNGVPIHTVKRVHSHDLDNTKFDHMWSQGEPIVADNTLERFKLNWTPRAFIKRAGNDPCLIQDCQTDMLEKSTIGKFFEQYKLPAAQRTENVSKLKDWPENQRFRDRCPDLFDDFSDALPAGDFARTDGVYNIFGHFPINTSAPDLGPKMYIAHAANDGPDGFGSTRLHMDIADAVNVLLKSSSLPNGEPGCAAWDIYKAEDADKLRAFLNEKYFDITVVDPIHAQRYFLNSELRKELYEKTGVYSFRIYQHPGEAVFIPAGCAHQVSNISDCIKIAVDFVSPHNVERCAKVMRELRDENVVKVWKADVLQFFNTMWYAWLSCSAKSKSLLEDNITMAHNTNSNPAGEIARDILRRLKAYFKQEDRWDRIQARLSGADMSLSSTETVDKCTAEGHTVFEPTGNDASEAVEGAVDGNTTIKSGVDHAAAVEGATGANDALEDAVYVGESFEGADDGDMTIKEAVDGDIEMEAEVEAAQEDRMRGIESLGGSSPLSALSDNYDN